MNLKDWTLLYLKNLDAMRIIKSTIQINDKNIVRNLDGKIEYYYIFNKLNEQILVLLSDKSICFVCLNKKENINFIIKNWEDLIKYEKIKFIMVNTDVNEKWILCPHIHNRISDKGSLKVGLFSLFQSVEEVS